MKTITKVVLKKRKEIIIRLFILTSVTIGLLSCNEETTTIQEQDVVSFLESYTLSKTSGSNYTLTYQTPQHVNASTSKVSEGVAAIHLFEERGIKSATRNQTYIVNNKPLQIDFTTGGSQKIASIQIADKGNKETSAKSSTITDLLNSYGITHTHGNDYTLDFQVPAGIEVHFAYNGALGIHEVHLTEGSASTEVQDYSKNYTLTDEVLYIDFVNHRSDRASRAISEDRIPRIGVIEFSN